MPAIQLDDEVFQAVKKRAADAGYANVDEYLNDVLLDEAEEFDRLFTPERLAHIDKVAAEMRAGKYYTMEEAEKVLDQRREQWLRENGH